MPLVPVFCTLFGFEFAMEKCDNDLNGLNTPQWNDDVVGGKWTKTPRLLFRFLCLIVQRKNTLFINFRVMKKYNMFLEQGNVFWTMFLLWPSLICVHIAQALFLPGNIQLRNLGAREQLLQLHTVKIENTLKQTYIQLQVSAYSNPDFCNVCQRI